VEARFGDDSDPGIRWYVATAALNKGDALRQLGRSDEAVRVYGELISRYGKDSEPEIRETVADARRNKKAALRKVH
jgi:hypothetical protein